MGEALELDDIDQALALHAAEARLGFPADQGFDRFHEQAHFLIGLGLDPILIDAQGIGAGAELLIANSSQNDQAKPGILAPRDGEHLQAVHLRQVQIDDEQGELFGFEQRQGPGTGIGHPHFRQAWQMLAQHLPIQIQKVLIVVQ